ncbi:histidinol dehydrogenase, partial [candidate division KSB1 bacterium]|nr:histidinol dehydrogenase [candidate division KSB1 bacterium]
MKEFQKSNELVEFWQWSANDKTDDLAHRVMQIIEDVRERKDSALIDYTKKFDGVDIRKFRVERSAIEKAKNQLDREFAEIVKNAVENIRKYHSRQIPESWLEKSKNGVTLGQKFTPIESVGIYVPGGRAAYPSTLIMNGVPAQLAGVPRIAVASPPCQNGEMNPLILGCAGLMEIDEIYCIGGAQAIAALAYGTESVKPVAMITGPGNKYVNEAKRQVFGKVGIDMPAGPTELVIFTDGSVSMEYIIWDLIAQAEHDPDAKTALISTSRNFNNDVMSNI